MRVRRRPVVDEYAEPEGSVVLVGERVLTLSPLASVALASLGEGWTTLDDAAQALEDAFGAPPQGSLEDATRETVLALAALGLLEVDPRPGRTEDCHPPRASSGPQPRPRTARRLPPATGCGP